MNEKTKNNKKILTILSLIVIAIIAAISVWYFNYGLDNGTNDNSANNGSTQQDNQTEKAQVSEDGKNVSYYGKEGQSALSLLKQYTQVETEEFTGIGEYVVSINGVESDSTNNFWSFYVNGEQAQVGAGDYITQNNDFIEWRLEDVTSFEE